MAIELPASMSSLKPKTLGIIVVGGIGLGLLWRRYSAGKAASAPAVDNTALPTTGNPLTGGSSDSTTTPNSPGSLNFPIVKWVITIGGVDYLTDGTNIWPIPGGSANDPGDTTTPPDTTTPNDGTGPLTGGPLFSDQTGTVFDTSTLPKSSSTSGAPRTPIFTR